MKLSILLFITSFLFIFLKSFQQINVTQRHLAWIVPTSMLMAFSEVYIVATTAKTGWDFMLVLGIGLGSGLGSLSATLVHPKMVSLFENKERL